MRACDQYVCEDVYNTFIHTTMYRTKEKRKKIIYIYSRRIHYIACVNRRLDSRRICNLIHIPRSGCATAVGPGGALLLHVPRAAQSTTISYSCCGSAYFSRDTLIFFLFFFFTLPRFSLFFIHFRDRVTSRVLIRSYNSLLFLASL